MMTTTATTIATDDIIAQLQVWSTQLCESSDYNIGTANGEGTSVDAGDRADHQGHPTPIDLAVKLIEGASWDGPSSTSHMIRHLLKTHRTAMQKNKSHDNNITTATSHICSAATTTAEMAKRKLQQIKWHVTLLLELWKKGGDTMVEVCAKLLQKHSPSQDGTRRKRSKRKRLPKTDVYNKSSSETIVLHYLVETLSQAPYLLPLGTSLQQFLTGVLCQTHWEALPRVVSHLFGAFEIPNPFTESSDDESMGDYFFSLKNSIPQQQQANNNNDSDGTKPDTLHRKRKRDRAEHKVLKKQRVLSTLKKNRFLAKSTSRTTHFQSKMHDISKLLENPSSTTPGSKTASQKMPPINGASVITPHLSQGKMISSEDNRSSEKKKTTVHSSSFTKKSNGLSKVPTTIRESPNEEAFTPPMGSAVRRATTLPDTSLSKLSRPFCMDDGVIGETLDKRMLQDVEVNRGIVGETPSLKRSRAMLADTRGPTSDVWKDIHSFGIDSDGQAFDLDTTATSVGKPAAVQPVKLFGAIRPNRPKPVEYAKKVPKDKNSANSGKSIQLARKLLRRRSV
ncbi:hypothetical protein IV203_008214 [Nitzschia inconspicua]|uniref:Uncharacterized protein n=1 Tax=Nitzschia inconspicua TaxID=303405 RepID=A0A9K3PMH3_9STRA|nr:hypothetical protein IV203_008214 [Nitzschia inconspicua]